MEFQLFLPQMRMTFDQLVERAQAAEAAGFTGIAGMDHLAPPMAEEQPMYEATVTNTWLAAHTKQMVVSSLVLCDSFRHPAVLAREAVSIDHASNGRFELGIGWGSVPTELGIYGIGSMEPRVRVGRLRESLEIMRALWSGETVDYEGEYFTLHQARQVPTPTRPIPITIGGTGPKTLQLVEEFADWWNLHTGVLDKIDELRPKVANARISMQHMVAFVPSESERESVVGLATKRFGRSNPVMGTGPELVDHFARLADKGVERIYAWFCDFAPPQTLAAFGAEVIAQLT